MNLAVGLGADLWRVAVAPLGLMLGVAVIAVLVGWLMVPVQRGMVGSLGRLALSVPLGLGTLATTAFLASVCRVSPWLGVGALGIALAPRCWRLRAELAADLNQWVLRSRETFVNQPLLGVLVVLLVAALVPLGWYPPLAFDANMYHLPLAAVIGVADGDLFAETLRYPVFPLLSESVWSLGWLAAGSRGAQTLTLIPTVATALLLLAWGRERLPGVWAWAPAGWWLGHPIVVRYASTAYVESWSAMFAVAALYAVDRGGRRGEGRWWLLAGLFGGWAVAVKYLGLLVVVTAAFAVVVERSRRTPSSLAIRLGWLALGVFAGAGIWYAWILGATGNPVFPYGTSIFGSSSWSELGRATTSSGAGKFFGRLLRMPWSIVVDRGSTGQQPPYSPLVWLLAPAVAAALWRRRGWLVPALVLPLLAFASFPLLPQDSRYVVPALAVAGIPIAWFLASWLERPRPWMVGLLVLSTLGGPAYCVWRMSVWGVPPLTPASEHQYLAQQAPLYPALAFTNHHLGAGETVYAVAAHDLNQLSTRRILGEFWGPFAYRGVLRYANRPQDLDLLLCSFGADALIWPEIAALPRLQPHQRWSRVYVDERAQVYDLACGRRDPAVTR